MKRLTLTWLIGLVSFCVFGQEITGQWNGLLKVQGIQLRIVFKIEKTKDGYSSTMDSPDQGAKGILVDSTSFSNSTLRLKLSKLAIEYEGVLDGGNSFNGTFKQRGLPIPLNLTREEIEKVKLVRPQEPTKPYPYYSEDVSFKNEGAGITLAGTLTLPQKDGSFPAVVLISGSGAQNRDEELLGHKPFLILSDYLTRNGIAVLRYDDRGTASSTGDYKSATSLDLSTDVEAGVKYLLSRKEINKKKIGLVGHSEGGLIAPMVATRSKVIAFIVLLAGTGIQGDELLLLQQELIAKAEGASDEKLVKTRNVSKKAFEMVVKSNDTEQLRQDLTNYIQNLIAEDPSEVPEGVRAPDFIKGQVDQLTSPWMQYFLKYNPATTLEKVKCPVLALNGEKDLQVPPKENLGAINKALTKGGNKKVTIIELPNLNHLFQECKTGSPTEYSAIEQTFSPVAQREIVKWIQMHMK